MVQLIRRWTSNWARVAFACEYTMTSEKRRRIRSRMFFQQGQMSPNSRKRRSKPVDGWDWSKAFLVTRINWFDKYLWRQDQLGQHSLDDARNQRLRGSCPHFLHPCVNVLCRDPCVTSPVRSGAAGQWRQQRGYRHWVAPRCEHIHRWFPGSHQEQKNRGGLVIFICWHLPYSNVPTSIIYGTTAR
jgi:hypothetical protein